MKGYLLNGFTMLLPLVKCQIAYKTNILRESHRTLRELEMFPSSVGPQMIYKITISGTSLITIASHKFLSSIHLHMTKYELVFMKGLSHKLHGNVFSPQYKFLDET